MQMLALASKSRETPSTKPLDLDAQRARSILAGSRLKLTTHPILEEEAEECVERRGSKKGAQAESFMRRGGGGVLAAAVVRRRDAAALPSSGRRPRPAVNHLADHAGPCRRCSELAIPMHFWLPCGQLLVKAPRRTARRGPYPTSNSARSKRERKKFSRTHPSRVGSAPRTLPIPPGRMPRIEILE